MTGDKSKLIDFVSKEGGYVTLETTIKGKLWEKEILEINTKHR